MVLLGVGVEDMIEIDEITDKAIAENLQRRLKSEIIYVSLLNKCHCFTTKAKDCCLKH